MSENIDYKKLLRMCMYNWMESEGCAWNGYIDEDIDEEIIKLFGPLSKEEVLEMDKIHNECYNRYNRIKL